MINTHFSPVKRWIKRVRAATSVVAIFALLVLSIPVPTAQAAAMTKINDTLSTLKSNVVANHTINFVLPTGVDAATDTISIDLTGFTNSGPADFTEVDLAVDGDANCDGAWTDKAIAASPTTATWGAAFSSLVLTLTAPTDATTGEITAGRCVQVEIGTNAEYGTTGGQQLTNPNNQSTLVVELTSELGTVDDSGTYALDFVAESAVNLTAVVDATLSFTISDTTIGFGSLSASTGRWATGDLAGENATASTTPTAAHTMAITTNARSGWAITYAGLTLAGVSPNTISAATITGDTDGAPNSEQFALTASTDGNSANIASGYLRGTNTADWNFANLATATTLASEGNATNTETITVSYLANIAGATEAGTYSTDITYVATATF